MTTMIRFDAYIHNDVQAVAFDALTAALIHDIAPWGKVEVVGAPDNRGVLITYDEVEGPFVVDPIPGLPGLVGLPFRGSRVEIAITNFYAFLAYSENGPDLEAIVRLDEQGLFFGTVRLYSSANVWSHIQWRHMHSVAVDTAFRELAARGL